jgi:hypothetical protein
MKWNKFMALQSQYPFLANDLSWRGVLRDTKEFVRKKIGYIAFRPFETLDLTSKATSSITVLKSAFRYTQMESYTSVEYQISFHVEGEGKHEGGSGVDRLRYVTSEVGDGSIQAHIDDVTAWFTSCEAFNGKQLIWERVVKRTVSGSSHVGLSNMNLEIYVFPRFYRFRSLPRTLPPPPSRARLAYLRGEPMPPLIPGTLRFTD